MCIRDRKEAAGINDHGAIVGTAVNDLLGITNGHAFLLSPCLLYTSDAADERSSVDLGGRRIIKKKKR